MTKNPCLLCNCGFYDSDFGCTCPGMDRWYACPLEPEPDWEEIMKPTPDCFTPEKDNPYPLCVGGKPECNDCCLYVDYEKYHDPYEEVRL